jgi:hypothetical protein
MLQMVRQFGPVDQNTTARPIADHQQQGGYDTNQFQ